MIGESIAFLPRRGKRVLFDAEHFFDGLARRPRLRPGLPARGGAAGAERAVLCDTNGPSLPGQDSPPRWPTSARPARSLRWASTATTTTRRRGRQLAGRRRGGRHAGAGDDERIGERTGNANLVTIIANLQLKMGIDVVTAEELGRLTETAHYVDELLNRNPAPDQPYVGKHRSRHKAGLHAAGSGPTARRSSTSTPPWSATAATCSSPSSPARGRSPTRRATPASASTTRRSRGSSSASRRSSTRASSSRRPTPASSCSCARRPASTSRSSGWSPGAASSSSAPTARSRPRPRSRSGSTASATCAPRRATAPSTRSTRPARRPRRDPPHLKDIELVNFKVRILDETHGTDAVTRVVLDSSDGTDTWGSIGVSENVIAASWQALVDSLEYGMQPGRRPQGRVGSESDLRA